MKTQTVKQNLQTDPNKPYTSSIIFEPSFSSGNRVVWWALDEFQWRSMSYALPGILGLDCGIWTNLIWSVWSHPVGSVGCTKDHPVAGLCRHCCGFSGNWDSKLQNWKIKWTFNLFLSFATKTSHEKWIDESHPSVILWVPKIWTKAAPAIWKLRRLYNPEATLATPADLWLCALTRGETQVAASDTLEWNLMCTVYSLIDIWYLPKNHEKRWS